MKMPTVSRILKLIEMKLKYPLGRDIQQSVQDLHKAGYVHSGSGGHMDAPGSSKPRTKLHLYGKPDGGEHEVITIDYNKHDKLGKINWMGIPPANPDDHPDDDYPEGSFNHGAKTLNRHLFKKNVLPFRRKR